MGNIMEISSLRIIAVRYLNATLVLDARIPLDTYAADQVYAAIDAPFEIVEPRLLDRQRTGDEIQDIGILGGIIADEVAAARKVGQSVLMVGGNCCHMTGVLGGLQAADGPQARIGLVWFDAHGDFNTSKTTLSGMLGGMPVAVAAGLTHPNWRESSRIVAPLPTSRILLVDVRNLDRAEEQLIRATDAVIAAAAPGFPGLPLDQAVADLATRVDQIYFHIDADILDERYTPNHGTKAPGGPSMDQVKAAIETVMSTGKVTAFAVVSVSGTGTDAEIMVASGMELIRSGLTDWQKFGQPEIKIK